MLEVISAETLWILSKNRYFFPHLQHQQDIGVSVIGQAESISELCSSPRQEKSDQNDDARLLKFCSTDENFLIAVRLKGSVVKNLCNVHVHQTVIISHLQVFKTGSEFVLLQSTNTTEIFTKDVLHKTFTTEFCHKYGNASISMPEVEPAKSESAKTRESSQLKSYKGCVTSCEQADDGIYILDGKIGLYIQYLEWNPCPPLDVGSNIVVYNVHQKGARQYPKIRLYCCSVSSIRESQGPQFKQDGKILQCHRQHSKSKSFMGHLVREHNLSMHQTEWLMSTRQSLEKKLVPKILRSVSNELMRAIFCEPFCGGVQCLSALNPRRDSFGEFLDTTHSSCNILGSVNNTCPFDILTLNDVVMYYDNNKQHGPSSVQSGSFVSDLWDYQMFDESTHRPPWVLIGVLRCNKKTAQIQLVDQTGAIDCVIAPRTADETPLSENEDNADDGNCSNVAAVHKSDVAACGSVLVDNINNSCNHGDSMSQSHTSQDISPLQTNKSLPSTSHSGGQCTRSECGRYLSELPQIDCHGDLVRVDNYQLVVEHFKESSMCRMYLCFSMTDLLCLKHKGQSANISSRPCDTEDQCSLHAGNSIQQISHDAKDSDVSSSNCFKRKSPNKCGCPRPAKCAATTSCKHHRFENVNDSSSSQLPPQITSQTLPGLTKTQAGMDSMTSKCSCDLKKRFVSQPFILVHKDSPHVQNRVTCKPQLTFYALATLIGTPFSGCQQCANTPSNEPGCSDVAATLLPGCSNVAAMSLQPAAMPTAGKLKPKLRHVASGFTGDSVRWYHLLRPGCMYKLVKSGSVDTKVFEYKLTPTGLRQAVEKTNTRQCIMIDSSTQVLSLYEQHSCDQNLLPCDMPHTIQTKLTKEGHLPSLVSIGEALQTVDSGKLLCIKGTVISRNFTHDQQNVSASYAKCLDKENLKLGVSAPGNPRLCLTIKDLTNQEELIVYMTLDNLSYPLGLLPGVCVQLEKVVMKTSKANRPYCQFLTASSYCILGVPCLKSVEFSGQVDKQRGASSTQNLDTYRIANLWSLDRTDTIQIICHIQQVQKLVLKVTCSGCGHVISHGDCSFSGCLHMAGNILHAKASMFVEDGTCNALAHLSGMAVRDMLGLNPEQWAALEQHVCKVGEISLQMRQMLVGLSVLEKWLVKLCKSPAVCRTALISASKFKSLTVRGSRFPSIQHMHLQDFEVTTLRLGEGGTETHSLPLLQLMGHGVKTLSASDRLQYLLFSANKGEHTSVKL